MTIACPQCAEQIPEHGGWCPYCRAEVKHPRSADPQHVEREGAGTSPVPLLVFGFVVAAILGGAAGYVAAVGGSLWLLLVTAGLGSVAWLVALVGLIGCGVEMGIRAARR